MEKMIRNKFWRKVRAMVVAAGAVMMVAGNCWGQSYTIQYKNGSRQTNIPERLDTVYIPDGASRELYVPELRNNDGRANKNYQWYVRWYRADANGDPIAISGKFQSTDVDLTGTDIIEGGTAAPEKHSAALHTDSENESLFWYAPFISETNYSSTATGASTILYTRSAGDTEDVVFCDVSMNRDYSPTGSLADGGTLTEPTLSKRYKFVIRPAKEIADKIQKANGAGIEHYEISSPSTAQGINIQMKTFPSNYCWYEGSSILSGDHYVYKGGKNGSLASDKQVIGLGSVTTLTKIEVYAKTSGGQESPLLATFTIIPQDNAAFMLEDNVKTSTDPRRNPDNHPDLYDPIGYADFDMNDVIPIGLLSSSNNLCGTPMSAESTTYAFLDPNKTIYTDHNHAALQNQYGLYRSANVSGVSNGSEYYWFFPLRGSGAAPVYDRTYANSNGTKSGYFFYTDASNEPGRWVKMELSDEICQYTELTVTAWVNDMTTWNETSQGKPLPPNININFIGKAKSGEEVVLHRFTSGDALTDYSATYDGVANKANINIGKWQQLCYTFSISSDQTGFEKYYLEVQNNTAHTYGADYAIDDVRVYKSKPHIEVYRENVCESSSLKLSTDYATILRNMGWTKGELVATDDEFDFSDLYNLDFRKFRYGLMGDSHQFINSTVGNVYFAFYDDKSGEWQTVNEAVADYSGNAAHSLRVAVSTVQSRDASGGTNGWEFYTNSETEALTFEQMMNLRAVDDYNKDIEE